MTSNSLYNTFLGFPLNGGAFAALTVGGNGATATIGFLPTGFREDTTFGGNGGTTPAIAPAGFFPLAGPISCAWILGTTPPCAIVTFFKS